MSKAEPYRIGNHSIAPLQADDEHLRDPRGLLWLYEPPHPNASYVIGVDPAYGIAGWDRFSRTDRDAKNDNGAIQVLRVGMNGSPDVQVAEYAAPIPPEDLAYYVNLLGRLYHGSDDQEQAKVIIEVQPGPGFATQNTLVHKYGYTNLWQWQHLDGMTPKPTKSFGWYSTSRTAVQLLWSRCTRHIYSKNLVIRSTFLLEELADCKFDADRGRGEAIHGSHDDRVSALFFAIWAAHDFSGQIQFPESSNVRQGPLVSYQACDMSAADADADWEDRFQSMLG